MGVQSFVWIGYDSSVGQKFVKFVIERFALSFGFHEKFYRVSLDSILHGVLHHRTSSSR